MPGEDRFKEPRVFDMPSYTMAVVDSGGDPAEDALQALYGAVYGLKFQARRAGRGDFKVGALRVRRPDYPRMTTACWGLPIPDGITELPTKPGEPEVRVEVWEYGAVAQILHVGLLSEAGPTVEYLHRFIEESGYEVAGPHEEEYLTATNAPDLKVYVRYHVRRQK